MFLRQNYKFMRTMNPMGLTSMPLRNISKHLKAFATIDPDNLSSSDKGFNLV